MFFIFVCLAITASLQPAYASSSPQDRVAAAKKRYENSPFRAQLEGLVASSGNDGDDLDAKVDATYERLFANAPLKASSVGSDHEYRLKDRLRNILISKEENEEDGGNPIEQFRKRFSGKNPFEESEKMLAEAKEHYGNQGD